METVVPPPADAELHLLTEWGDPNSRGRTRTAAVSSVLVHVAAILLVVSLPAGFLDGPPPERVAPRIHQVVTPLVEPTEFTQKTPNKGKIAKELDVASLQPRERVRAPQAAPSTTRPRAQRPAPIPAAAATKSDRGEAQAGGGKCRRAAAARGPRG